MMYFPIGLRAALFLQALTVAVLAIEKGKLAFHSVLCASIPRASIRRVSIPHVSIPCMLNG